MMAEREPEKAFELRCERRTHAFLVGGAIEIHCQYCFIGTKDIPPVGRGDR